MAAHDRIRLTDQLQRGPASAGPLHLWRRCSHNADRRYSVRQRSKERTWQAELGESRFAPEELIDLADGQLLVIGRVQGSGLASGAGFDSDWALLLRLSDGLVVQEQVFFDRNEALETVALRR